MVKRFVAAVAWSVVASATVLPEARGEEAAAALDPAPGIGSRLSILGPLPRVPAALRPPLGWDLPPGPTGAPHPWAPSPGTADLLAHPVLNGTAATWFDPKERLRWMHEPSLYGGSSAAPK